MGILNITPDSFSDGGIYGDTDAVLYKAEQMIKDGADILDVGGQSTRPGAEFVCPDEEFSRIADIVIKIKQNFEIPLSVDTFYPEVAEQCADLGADIINDVSGAVNEKMLQIVKKYSCGYIVTDNLSTFHSNKLSVLHADDLSVSVPHKLKELSEAAVNFGIDRECICIDPGLGFNKTTADNMNILGNMDKLNFGFPILIGASRKRFIGELFDISEPIERDNATAVVSALCAVKGANILRVHDVLANKKTVDFAWEMYK